MTYIVICHHYVIQVAFQLIKHYFYCIYKAIGWKEIENKSRTSSVTAGSGRILPCLSVLGQGGALVSQGCCIRSEHNLDGLTHQEFVLCPFWWCRWGRALSEGSRGGSFPSLPASDGRWRCAVSPACTLPLPHTGVPLYPVS